MTTTVLLVLLIWTVLCPLVTCYEHTWEAYKLEHDKKYLHDDEESSRKLIFFNHSRLIDLHNELAKNNETTFETGHNKYSDLTPLEYHKFLKGFISKPRSHAQMSLRTQYLENLRNSYKGTIPSSWNWLEHDAVTNVKDQGFCGSCYTYGTVGALEGMLKVQYNVSMTSLSTQELLDCSANEGCQGGLLTTSFQYVHEKMGINSDEGYPYSSSQKNCTPVKQRFAPIKDYGEVPENDELALRDAVYLMGPIAVGIDANHFSMMVYRRGIYYEPSCNKDDLDHAVLVVGYGNENGHDYWLIKNSWGNSWGENGYMKLIRNKHNHCGIATSAAFPIPLDSV